MSDKLIFCKIWDEKNTKKGETKSYSYLPKPTRAKRLLAGIDAYMLEKLGIPNLSGGNILIPFPPLFLQIEIAEHIQAAWAEAKRLENEAKDEVVKAKKEVERLVLG